MYKYSIILWLILPAFLCKAQKSETLKDTIELEEVKVSVNLPLDDNDIVDFYRTNQFSTLDNINARLEGMSLIKRGAYALEPQLNGFSGGQLNVTIEGMKMFGACTDRMDPITSYVEPTNLKSIAISNGTNGSHNGCTIGGSVDMTLQGPPATGVHPFSSSVGLGYESVSRSRNILVSSGESKKKWAWGIDGVYRKNENYQDGNDETIPFTQFEKTNIHSVIQYSARQKSIFKADLLYDEARNVGYPALPMDVSLARATLFALEFRRNGKTQLKGKAYYNTISHVMDDSKRDSLYLLKNDWGSKSDSIFMRMDMPGRSSTVGAYLQVIIPLNDHHTLTLKADNYTNHSLAEMTMHMRYAGFPRESPMYMQTWPEMLRNVAGIFVQSTMFISPKASFSINGRIDYNVDLLQSKYGQQQFSIFNYSLDKTQKRFLKSMNISLQYLLLKGVSMAATTGYSERMPTIGERLGFYLFNAYDGYDYIGNPILQTEKSRFMSLALQLAVPKLKINLNQSLSLINDYIMGATDTVIPTMNFYAKGIRVYTNMPDAMLYSADVQVLYNPFKNLSVFSSSKFTFGELNSEIPMPLIPPLKTIVAVQYQNNQFSLQAESESAIAQNRINSNYGESTTPAFTIFNAKSSLTVIYAKKVIDIGLGVTNILDRAYYEHLDWGRINRPGRSMEMLLKLTF